MHYHTVLNTNLIIGLIYGKAVIYQVNNWRCWYQWESKGCG
jgi:hypothetical protein